MFAPTGWMGSIRGDTQYRDLAIKQLTDLTIRSRSELPLAQSGQAHYLGSKKDAVLDGDCRQLKMLPFAKLAQSAGGIICCFARIRWPRGDVLFDSLP